MADQPNARNLDGNAAPEYRGTTLYSGSWALVVGIDGYQSPIPALQYAERDALAMSVLLPSLGFPESNTRLLLASKGGVTRDRIESVLDNDLNPKMGKDDRLLIYFAGHGVTSEIHGEFHGHLLLPGSLVHGQWPSAERLYLERPPSDALGMEDLLNQVHRLPPKHKLLLIDACFSRFMKPRSAETQGAVVRNDPRLRRWAASPVTQVLTAGRSGERASELARYGHGVFTHYVLQALRGHADLRGDGLITFGDLARFVRDGVGAELDVSQDPQDGKFGSGEGQFLFVYQNWAAQAEESEEDARQTRIRELARQGRQAFDACQYEVAVLKWQEALDLAPLDASLKQSVALASEKLRKAEARREQEHREAEERTRKERTEQKRRTEETLRRQAEDRAEAARKAEAKELTDQGTQAFDAGQYEAAVSKWQEALDLSPSEGSLRQSVALARDKLRKADARREQEHREAEERTRKERAEQERITEERRRREAEKRAEAARKAEIRELTDQGTQAFDAGQYEVAVSKWQECLKLSPSDASFKQSIALARDKLRKAEARSKRERREAEERLREQRLEEERRPHEVPNNAQEAARTRMRRTALGAVGFAVLVCLALVAAVWVVRRVWHIPVPNQGFRMEFVSIPAGTFGMGSTTGDSREKPVHRVRITKPFEMGKYEVTQSQWEAVMGGQPEPIQGHRPASRSSVLE